jgi:hypothetical protein
LAGDASFIPAGIDAVVVATAAPIWFPSAGYVKAFVAPTTAAEGVRVAPGKADVVSQTSDRAVMTVDNAAAVIGISGGFWLRRFGSVNCTTTVRLGT